MTSKTDELFELVKSLTGSEKRYFKIFSSRHVTKGENLYLELFDWIDQQEAYDEKQLKQDFKGSPLLKQLPVLKNYLKKNILKSLKNYTQPPSVNAEVREMIEYIELLFKKRLFHHCYKIIKKAIKIAEGYEHFNHLLILLNWELKVAQELNDLETVERYLSHTIHKQYHILEQIKDDLIIRKVVMRFLEIYGKVGKPISAKNIEVLKNFMKQNPINHTPLSHRANRNYHIIHCIYNDAIGDFETCHHYNKALVDAYFSKYEDKIIHNAYDISDALVHIIQHGLFLNHQKDIDKYLNYLKVLIEKIPNKEKHKKTDAQYALLKSQLYIALYHNQSLKIKSNIDGIKIIVNKSKESLTRYNELLSYMLLCQSHVALKVYDQAIPWIYKILNFKGKVPTNTLIQAELYNLICQYELGNEEVVISIIRSLRRRFKTQKNQLTFEFQLFSSLLKIINTPEKQVIETLFEELSQTLSNTEPSKYHEYHIIGQWIKSYSTISVYS